MMSTFMSATHIMNEKSLYQQNQLATFGTSFFSTGIPFLAPTIQSFTPSPATNIPPEIFALICEYLVPQDLLSMSAVCKAFRNFLFSQSSIVTQQIWRNSRRMVLPSLTEPPLEGMDERKYTTFLLVQKSCQVCHKSQNSKPFPIYWEFRVRCCDSCFTANTISHPQLVKQKLCRALLSVLPYMRRIEKLKQVYAHGRTVDTPTRLHIYWLPEVKKIVEEFLCLKPKQRQHKLREEAAKFGQKMQDIQRRREAYAFEMKRAAEHMRKTRFARAINELKNERAFDGTPKFYAPLFDYCKTRDEPLRFFIYTDKDWRDWRNRVEKEYNMMMERANQFKPIMCNPL